MRCRTLGKPGWPWAGVFLALLACGLVAPAAARAGCGNHVPVSSYLSGAAAPFDPLILGGFPEARAADPTPTPPANAPRPCTGAMCSGKSGLPVPPPPLFSHHAEDWAWLDLRFSADDDASSADLQTEAAPRPIHTDRSIFHPPR